MPTFHSFLVFAAFFLFVLSALAVESRVNLQSAGLACLTATLFL